MNKRITESLVGAALVFTASAVTAAPLGKAIAQQGNGKGAPGCISCHGDKGQGNAAAGYPYLAGQPKEYLVNQLKAFTDKTRTSPVMQPFAGALSAEEMEAVADYFSQLPLPAPAGGNVVSDVSGPGERLVRQGKWSVGMPACFQCHGDRGQGVASHFPAISGQSEGYLKKQLEHWRKGERSNDPIGLMQAVAGHLEESEIAAVSSYLSTLSPVKVP